tara:strand:+ start:528 stop:1067 length:540 start_codon:yes stop_codon:yes gene_type:complete
MMKNEKIIISGPPGSGKTTIIKKLKLKGYCVHDEIHPQEINRKATKLELSNYLFQNRIKQYHDKSINNYKYNSNKQQNNQLIFFDRSIIDVIAYMDFWEEKYPIQWEETILKFRYMNNIFYAPNWKEIYKSTEERPEDYMEAEKIDLFLRKTYLKFNYHIIEIPKLNINQRVNFILDSI